MFDYINYLILLSYPKNKYGKITISSYNVDCLYYKRSTNNMLKKYEHEQDYLGTW